ncbi:MAG: MgtC/SapB family protein [Planctomycetota bacterium]
MSWQDLFGIILAVILGGIIGIEREISGKSAGLRTNVLICLGAAAFTIISRQMTGGEGDSFTRIAAGVVTGVGFLGAGAIIQDRGGVHGLTTAATIWLVAGIGMACGARLYGLAVLTVLIAMIVLVGLGYVAKAIEQHHKKRGVEERSEEEI